MSFFREPDWQGPFTLGMWQIRYDLDPDHVIVFVRGGGRRESIQPENEWGAGILRGGVQDRGAEQRLLGSPELAGKVWCVPIGGSPWLCLHGRDIDAVTDQA